MAGKSIVYVGIDLHKDSLTICVRNSQGKCCFTTIPTRCRNIIITFFKKLDSKYIVYAAVEFVGFYHWFWDLVEPLCKKLVLADAANVRAAASRKAKTDKNDAATIARLLSQDSLPLAFVPDPELRNARNIGRHRQRIKRRIIFCKASIRMELNKLGLPGPKDLNTGSLHKWFSANFNKVSFAGQLAIEDLQEQLALFEKFRSTRGKKKAIVRLVDKMLGWAWAMERNKTLFDVKKLAS